MFHYSKKCIFIFVFLLSYGSVTNSFIKRINTNDDSLMSPDAVEALSTMQSILNEMNKELEEKIQKEEDKAIKEEEKEEEITKEEDSEKKESTDELDTQTSTETVKEEEPEKEPSAGEGETVKEEENPSTTLETESGENAITPISEFPSAATEEPINAPKGTFAVWNANNKICILAKFQVVFSITYSSKGGEQKAEVHVPEHGTAKGKCETSSGSRLLQISWSKYVFTMIFNKTEDNWFATSVKLTYDTSDHLFDGATNSGKKTARNEAVNLFETPLQKSFYCPAEEVVLMYSGNKHVVTARLKDVYLQPYDIEDGTFSPVQRCSKVVIDGPNAEPHFQDETVPLAVGCTLALITLLILLGFSFHRAYNAAKVDYNTME